MDPRYAWMVTLNGNPNPLTMMNLEGVDLTRNGVPWLQELMQGIENFANGHGRSFSHLVVGEWALYSKRFEGLDDSILVTRAAQALLDEAGQSEVRLGLIVRRIEEPAGFGYSIWGDLDCIYVGANSPQNPDKDPGGR